MRRTQAERDEVAVQAAHDADAAWMRWHHGGFEGFEGNMRAWSDAVERSNKAERRKR